MTPLFRSEALAARAHQLHGSIRLAQPLGYSVAAAVAVVLTAGVLAFLTFGEVTKRATVTGILTPPGGLAKLIAPATATLTNVAVTEGQAVTAGQTLFVFSTERQSDAGATQAAIAGQLAARRQLAEQDARRAQDRYAERQRTAQDRLRVLELEAANLDKEIALAQSRAQLARKQLERSAQLAKEGFLSEGQQQVKQDELLASEQQLQALQRTRTAIAKDRASLTAQQQDAAQQLASDQADASKALALIGQESAENAARMQLVITAPQSGIISGLTASTGQMLAAGATLAQLIPLQNTANQQEAIVTPSPISTGEVRGVSQSTALRHESSKPLASGGRSSASKTDEPTSILQAHFYAPTRSAGFVEPGQTVRLRYAAYPYQKFGQQQGIVVSVDKTPYAPQELPAQVVAALQAGSAQPSAEAAYKITVQLQEQSIQAYGKAQRLKPGMLVEADIVQRTQKIYELILEPLTGFAARSGG